jgi:hypothetical protein
MVVEVNMKKTLIVSLILIGFLVVAVNAQTNVIPNPSLEQGIGSPDNWNVGSNAYWSTDGHTGMHSIALNPTGGSGDWRCNYFQVKGSAKYSFVFWVKGSYTSGEFYVYLRWFSNANGTGFISQDTYRIWGSYSSWVDVNETLTSPSNAKSGDIFYRAEAGSTGDLKTDDFQLSEIVAEQSLLYELFYGSGFWFTLIIMLAVILIVSTWNPYGGILFLPITIFLGIDYMKNIPGSSNFIWGAIVMMFASVYIFLMLGLKLGKK